MCGITGFCSFGQKFNLELISQMTNQLTHRGPDDFGVELFDFENSQIGLGQRRLSILDLSSGGHQPMKFQNLSIIYNGEVYNFKEIKKELEDKGYTFRSNSDTEVILKSFHCWKEKAVHKFIGMYAFVIYDEKEGELFIFRDRAGVKPLYYFWNNKLLLFSSELKSLFKHPHFRKDIDINSLSLFLQYSYIPAPFSIFKNTFKLKPGHYLKIKIRSKQVDEIKYWDVNDFYNLPKLQISEQEAIDETEKLLKSSYEYRMVADVPVGIFLSGGYDSSSVAALLQKNRTQKLKTFTIGYHENEYNEAPEAKKIAEYLGTDHTEYYVSANEVAEVLPLLPEIYDEPFADNSTVPTTLVSKLAVKDVKVALSADGGDEIFGGYHKFNWSVKYTHYPIWMQFLLSRSMRLINPDYLPYFNKTYNFSTRYEKMRKIWEESSAVSAMKYISQYITEKETNLLLQEDIEKYKTYFDSESSINDYNDSINKMLAIDYKTFLADNNLVKVDRATMSVSLEGREPMLDHRIIEFVARLPSNYKIKDGTNKYILKEIVHRHIPKQLMERPKMPFVAPLTLWFKDELKEKMLDYLDVNRLKAEGIFNAEYVIKLRDKYFANGKISHQKLWNILIFQMWYEKWLK